MSDNYSNRLTNEKAKKNEQYIADIAKDAASYTLLINYIFIYICYLCKEPPFSDNLPVLFGRVSLHVAVSQLQGEKCSQTLKR